jgi:uncharacterized damage-inducible protein DinB
MITPMNKHELLVNLNVARAELSRALLGISASDFEAAPVVGDWAPRDTVAHIAAWEHWVCNAIRALRAGQAGPAELNAGHEDTFNAKAVAQRKAWPLKQLLDEFSVARRQLIVAVGGASQEQLTRVYTIEDRPLSIAGLATSIINHDEEHTPQLRAWKAAKEGGRQAGPKLVLQLALDTNRSALLALLDTIPTSERETTVIDGGVWTAKDVCGHIADWDQVFADVIFATERHTPFTWAAEYGESWNQAHASERRKHSWARVWKDLVDRRGTIVTELQERILEPDLARSLSTPWGEMTFYQWLCIPCDHDAEHAAALLAWFRARRGA